MFGAAVPTAPWPVYQARLDFGAATTTVVSACYPLALLPATVLAGVVADVVGTQPVVAISCTLVMRDQPDEFVDAIRSFVPIAT